MTIGIVTVAHGITYHNFLPEWSRAVAALETTPDQITIVHDGIDDAITSSMADLTNVVWVHDTTTRIRNHPQILVNSAIAVTLTDWIVKLDVDDLILPHALNTVHTCESDVLNFGYRIGTNDHISRPVTANEIMERNNNPMASCSPFRRWLWERNPYRDMVFDDWAFWFDAARNGATFNATCSVDYVYRVHDDQITRKHDLRSATNAVRSL